MEFSEAGLPKRIYVKYVIRPPFCSWLSDAGLLKAAGNKGFSREKSLLAMPAGN